MARGWESKSIEAQQEEAARPDARGPALSAEARERLARRQVLELALARARDDLSRAAAPAHRTLLARTIAALEAELAGLA
jgi:hypothetical protein